MDNITKNKIILSSIQQFSLSELFKSQLRLSRNFFDYKISFLMDKVITKIEKWHDNILIFHTEDEIYAMGHGQECCEEVYIEDITGDFKDLIGSPIVRVAEESNKIELDENDEYAGFKTHQIHRWTFYKLATYKGYVDIRWNCYSHTDYSVRVDFFEISLETYKSIKEEFEGKIEMTIFD